LPAPQGGEAVVLSIMSMCVLFTSNHSSSIPHEEAAVSFSKADAKVARFPEFARGWVWIFFSRKIPYGREDMRIKLLGKLLKNAKCEN
ncbi:MAG: hypothetical protein ACI35N_05780, partial [Marinilabiliaceae bacterium]